jgi:hypothetical protein
MGDLAVGDEVFDETGARCRVTFATETMTDHPCYRVEFSDGTSIVADEEHLWETRCLDRKTTTRTTREIADTLLRKSDGARRHSIPVAGALDTPDADLPIDPYVFGAWLGDGSTSAGRITFGEDSVREQIESAGYELGEDSQRDQPDKTAEVRTVYGLSAELRRAGVFGNKHIPTAYLRASVAQRTALLQGLMDTDGFCSPRGQAELVTVKPRLRDDALELIRSLGIKPTLTTDRAVCDGKDCGPRYRIQFCAFKDQPVFRMPRKAECQKDRPNRCARSTTRQITAVEPVASVPVRCIQVDSDSHLYLAGPGMVPTHNTTLLAAIAIYHLLTTPDAACYVGASSRDQAKILFDEAIKLIRRTKWITERQGKFGKGLVQIQDGYKRILNAEDSGMVQVLAADAGTADGVIPTLALVDELHRHRSSDLYAVFRDGLGPRNGQMVTISTAGMILIHRLAVFGLMPGSCRGFRRRVLTPMRGLGRSLITSTR